MKTQNQRIGYKIKEFRTNKKLLQSELGDKIGVQANTISAYERGLIEVPRSRLEDLADVLDVTLGDLLGTTEEITEVHRVEESTALSVKELSFISSIIEKTMSLNKQEREKLMDNLKLAIRFFEDGSL
jgi:transcriptional regulator with XRE-family HTH domain